MSIETELKLSIVPKNANKLMRHPLLQSAIHTTSQHLYNTYFDTLEHDLLAHGVGLRVRRIGDRRLQTLKTAGSRLGGLHQRQEWEMPIASDVPDFSQLPRDILPDWCNDPKKQKKIKPLFTTDFTRTTWYLAIDNTSIEMVFDQGEIKTDCATHSLSEIELELKSGSVDKLYHVALILQETLSLRIENKSKAERGYRLQPQSFTYHKAGTVELSVDMTAEQAFIHLIWHCVGHLQANEDVVLYGHDIEGVHQMRVALRRLRSCLSLYEPLIPKKIHRKLRKQLKWITCLLGVARDWDVFALTLQQILEQSSQSSLNYKALKALQITVAKLQEKAYVTVRKALRSSRYTRMLLLLGQWLNQRFWRKKLEVDHLQNLEHPAREFANQVLEEHYQHVYQQGKDFTRLSPSQRHALRISIKKMGYGTRFFSTLYSSQTHHIFSKKLSQLQDELGILNDGRVAAQLLNQLDLSKNSSLKHFFKGWYAHQQMIHSTHLEEVWQSFIKQDVFWRNR